MGRSRQRTQNRSGHSDLGHQLKRAIDAILNLMPKEIRGKLFTPNVHMDAIYIRSLFSASDRALIGSQPSRRCATGRLTRVAGDRRCPAAESSVAFQIIACPSVPMPLPLPLCRRLPCVTGERVDGVSSVTKRKRSVTKRKQNGRRSDNTRAIFVSWKRVPGVTFLRNFGESAKLTVAFSAKHSHVLRVPSDTNRSHLYDCVRRR